MQIKQKKTEREIKQLTINVPYTCGPVRFSVLVLLSVSFYKQQDFTYRDKNMTSSDNHKNMFGENNSSNPQPESNDNKHSRNVIYEVSGFVLLVTILCVLCCLKKKCNRHKKDQKNLYEISETSYLLESGNQVGDQSQNSSVEPHSSYLSIFEGSLHNPELFIFDSSYINYNRLHIDKLIGIGEIFFKVLASDGDGDGAKRCKLIRMTACLGAEL